MFLIYAAEILKTVWVQAHVGSNPTVSATNARKHCVCGLFVFPTFLFIIRLASKFWGHIGCFGGHIVLNSNLLIWF